MNDLALDQRLRPAAEGYSAIVALVCASVAFGAPWALMMPPALGAVSGALALAFSVHRARQAWAVVVYRYWLTTYKLTKLHPSKIPVPKDQLYLGEGFSWGQEHTQRKLDAAAPEAKPFLRPPRRLSILMPAARSFEAWAEVQASKPRRLLMAPLASAAIRAASLTATVAPWNPVAPRLDLGGTPVLHGVEPRERPVSMRQLVRNAHLLVIGTTRVGKTRLLELLATQDIHAGRVVIVIDPKGDADLMMRMYAEASRAGRLHQFHLFHLGYPDFSARYNGIASFSRITEVAARVTNGLPSTGNSAAFKEFSWRFSNLVAQAQVALGRVPTYELLLRDITNIEPLFLEYATLVFARAEAGKRIDGWKARLEKLLADIEWSRSDRKAPGPAIPRTLQDREANVVATYLLAKELRFADPVLDGLAQAVSYEKSFFEKIIASLGPFLEKLTTGAVGKLISPNYFDADDPRPIFDWMSIIRQGGIVYVGLDALSDSVIASAVGNSMLADLVSVGGKIYKEGIEPNRPDGKIVLPAVACHFDEVNEIAGPEFVPMVNKMGGAGFWISAYTQTIPDIQARVGDRAKAEQILGNFNHLAMLRVKSLETAQFLVDQLPRVDVVALTAVSGVTDTAADGATKHFISNNQDRIAKTKEPMLEPADVFQLPQGQCFALLEGNRLSKIRIPLPDTSADALIPASLQAICRDMRTRYRSSEHWAQETDWFGDHPIGLTPGMIPPDAGVAPPALAPRLDAAIGPHSLAFPALADLGPLPSQEVTT